MGRQRKGHSLPLFCFTGLPSALLRSLQAGEASSLCYDWWRLKWCTMGRWGSWQGSLLFIFSPYWNLVIAQTHFALHRRVREGVGEGSREGLQRTATRKILVLAFHFLILCRLFIYWTQHERGLLLKARCREKLFFLSLSCSAICPNFFLVSCYFHPAFYKD